MHLELNDFGYCTAGSRHCLGTGANADPGRNGGASQPTTVTGSLHILDRRGKTKMASITRLRYVPLQHFQSLGRNTHQAIYPVHPFIIWLKKPQTCHFFQINKRKF